MQRATAVGQVFSGRFGQERARIVREPDNQGKYLVFMRKPKPGR
jgi:hypothetical protein